jgi:hypothetical protein
VKMFRFKLVAVLLALLCLAPATRPRVFVAWDPAPAAERRLNIVYWLYRSSDQITWNLAYKTTSSSAPVPYTTETVYWRARANSALNGMTSDWSNVARQN